MSADTTIKVPVETRDRLARLAAERKASIGGLVSEWAEATPTAEEIAAERERTRATLAELGAELTPEDLAAGEQLWAALDAGDDDALLRAAGE
jgi:hypothetical protein